MAVVKFGTPVDFMTLKMLRRICRGSGLYYDLSTTRAQLISKINT